MKKLLVPLLMLSGCSLATDSDYSRLTIQVPGPAPESRVFEGLSFLTPPSSSSSFNCLVVNVMGPGIAPAFHGQSSSYPPLPAIISGTTSCGYPGISAILPNTTGVNSKITLKVPAGPKRVVQVAGVQLGGVFDVCQYGRLDQTSSGNNQNEFYELGRTTLDIFHDAQVAVDENWNTLTATEQADRKVNCNLFQPYHLEVEGTPGLIAYWRLNEPAAATSAVDFKSSALNPMNFQAGSIPSGTVAGPILTDVQPAFQVSTGGALYGSLIPSSTFQNDVFAFEIWVKIPSGTCNTSADFFHMAHSADTDEIGIGCFPGGYPGLYVSDNTGVSASTVGTTPLDDGKWHYLVGQKVDATTIQLWMDGIPSTPSTTAFAANGWTWIGGPQWTEIGLYTLGTQVQPGFYAEAAIYNQPLTPQRIVEHYMAAGYTPGVGP